MTGHSQLPDLAQAAQHLTTLGMRILDTGAQLGDKHAGVIAVQDKTLIACVVRPTPQMSPRTIRGIRRAAIRWIFAHGLLLDGARIDVITPGPGTGQLAHHPDAG